MIALPKSVPGKGQEFFYTFLVDDMAISHLPSLYSEIAKALCCATASGNLALSTCLMLASPVQSVNLAEKQVNSMEVLWSLGDEYLYKSATISPQNSSKIIYRLALEVARCATLKMTGLKS